MKIDYSTKFKREYKNLPIAIKLIVKKKLAIFVINPTDPKLRTHKLLGKLSEYWSFSIDYRHRIIFSYSGKDRILLHAVGDHSIYR